MRERPILFSSPMVRALLAGTKTQTRRVVKPRHGGVITGPAAEQCAVEAYGGGDRRSASRIECVPCLYGVPGDRLWVRERVGIIPLSNGGEKIIYDATEGVVPGDAVRFLRSIFMPRRLSRITLEVTGVRVERVQDIGWRDCEAEGVHCDQEAGIAPYTSWQDAYAALWDSINGKKAPWSSNPWVWAIAFRRLP